MQFIEAVNLFLIKNCENFPVGFSIEEHGMKWFDKKVFDRGGGKDLKIVINHMVVFQNS